MGHGDDEYNLEYDCIAVVTAEKIFVFFQTQRPGVFLTSYKITLFGETLKS